MPPLADDLPGDSRAALVESIQGVIHEADLAYIREDGRGPKRRLKRDEFEQNLRDVLKPPELDIRAILPEDREGHRFNKTSETLDMSRVQLAAYLDAADAALRKATASGPKPTVTKFRAVATSLLLSPVEGGGAFRGEMAALGLGGLKGEVPGESGNGIGWGPLVA